MTTLQKLSISGIRSFPPGDVNTLDLSGKQLCIVQGMNGCGKTTIIECLKYVSTGSLPPGSNSGQSFVHDPKMAGLPEVKAQVKLLFTTRNKTKVFVSRNLRVNQMTKKLNFKQLEGVIKTRTESRKEQSLSGKCAELDKAVPDFMGVSKAILENVIFCHQEESLWPLMESSVLKKKLDEIFESARYNKALEEVRKQKKRLTDKSKDYKSDWKVLDVQKQNSYRLEDEREDVLEKLQVKQDEADFLQSKLSALETKANELEAALELARSERTKLQKFEFEYAERKKRSTMEINKLVKEYSKATVQQYFGKDRPECVEELELKLQGLQKGEIEFARKEEDGKRELDRMRAALEVHQKEIHRLEQERAGLVSKKQMEVEMEEKLISTLLEFHRLHPLKDKTALKVLDETWSQQSSMDSEGERARRRADAIKEGLAGLRKAVESSRDQLLKKETEVEESRKSDHKDLAELQSANGIATAAYETGKAEVDRLEKQFSELTNSLKTSTQGGTQKDKLDAIDQEIMKLNKDKDRLALEAGDSTIAQNLKDMESQIEIAKRRVAELEANVLTLEGKQEQLVHFKGAVARMKETKEDQLVKMHSFREPVQRLIALSRTDLGQTFTDAFTLLENTHDVKGLDEAEVTLGNQAKAALACATALDEEQTRLSKALSERKSMIRDLENEAQENKVSQAHCVKNLDVLNAEVKDLYAKEEGLPEFVKTKYKAMTTFNKEAANEIRDMCDQMVEDASDKLRESLVKRDMGRLQIKRVLREMSKSGESTAMCPTCFRDFEPNYPHGHEKIPSAMLERVVDSKFRLLHDIYYDANQALSETGVAAKRSKRELKVQLSQGTVLSGVNLWLANIITALGLGEEHEAAEELQKGLALAKEDQRLVNELLPQLERRDIIKESIENDKRELEKASDRLEAIKEELEKLESETEELEERSSNCTMANEAVKEVLKCAEETLRFCESAVSIASRVGLDATERDSFYLLASSFSQGDMPLDVARQELRSKNMEIKQLEEDRERLRSSRNSNQQEIQRITMEISSKTEEKIELREGAIKLEQAQNRRDELLKQCQQQRDKLSVLKTEARVAEKALSTRMATEAKAKAQGDQVVRKFREQLKEVADKLTFAENQMETIRGYKDLNVGEAIHKLDLALADLGSDVARERKALERRSEELHLLHRDAKSQVDLKHMIERIYEFALEHRKVTELKARRAELTEALAKNAGGVTPADHQNVITEMNEIKQKLAGLGGRLDELRNRSKQLQAQLGQEEYRDIGRRTYEASIKFRTTELAAQDLDKYYTALDTALMQFHQEKIEEINRSISQLWPVMYRGGDIDRIELRSEKSTTAKRSFNYKVVMTKSDTQLDMRGRCSAGQKVMAALVIRMALAESFSVNCGILALDEPTTNLDAKNKIGLAQSLSDIVKQYTKMQLIIITHDEEFVEELQSKLTAANQEASYYKVKRRLNASSKYVSCIELA